MKRKLVLILLCAVVLLGGAGIYLLTPYPVAPELEHLEISAVLRPDVENSSCESITDQVDLDALAQRIAACEASRLPFYQNSYSMDTVQYEINVLCREKPLHFVLGEDSFVYESGPWYHRLRDAQPLIDALDRDIAANGTQA